MLQQVVVYVQHFPLWHILSTGGLHQKSEGGDQDQHLYSITCPMMTLINRQFL